MLSFNVDPFLERTIYVLGALILWLGISIVGARFVRVIETLGRLFRVVPTTISSSIERVLLQNPISTKFAFIEITKSALAKAVNSLVDLLVRLETSLDKAIDGTLRVFHPSRIELLAKLNWGTNEKRGGNELITTEDDRRERSEISGQLRTQKFVGAMFEFALLCYFINASVIELEQLLYSQKTGISLFAYLNQAPEIASTIGAFIALGLIESELRSLSGFTHFASFHEGSRRFFLSLTKIGMLALLLNLGCIIAPILLVQAGSNDFNQSIQLIQALITPFILLMTTLLLTGATIGVFSIVAILLFILKGLTLLLESVLKLVFGILAESLMELLNLGIVVLLKLIQLLCQMLDLLIEHGFTLLTQIIIVFLSLPNQLMRSRLPTLEPIEPLQLTHLVK